MKRLLIPFVTLAMVMLPAAANAQQCRDSATGKFAKCGAAGAVPASQYMAKSTAKAKMPMAMPMPAAKPGMMTMTKTKGKPAMVKATRCKTAKGKFVKCGTPGAMPT